MDRVLSEEFPLIVADPEMLAGKPRVKDTRISVQHILEVLASGSNIEDLQRGYPALSAAAIREAILFAASSLGRPAEAMHFAAS